jgi:ABC-type multidrug transport system fused ATPase/permease subunit
MFAAEWGTGQVFWSLLWFFLFFVWIIILFQVFIDIFRSDDLGGWGKALWVIFVIIVPFLGVFVYLIARGSKMQEHRIADAKAMNEANQAYIRQVAASGTSDADQLDKLAALHNDGKLSDAEYAAAKAKVLGV